MLDRCCLLGHLALTDQGVGCGTQQEPVLFKGTIADNIANGKEGATREAIISAAKAANCHDFITTFKDGWVGVHRCGLVAFCV